jgi:hypothetical protein
MTCILTRILLSAIFGSFTFAAEIEQNYAIEKEIYLVNIHEYESDG